MAQIFSSKAFDVIGDAVYAVFDAAAKQYLKSKKGGDFNDFVDSQEFLNIHSETTFKFIDKMKKCMDKDLALETTKDFFKEIIYLKDKWSSYEFTCGEEFGQKVAGMFLNRKFIDSLYERAKTALIKNKIEGVDQLGDSDAYHECARVIGLLCLNAIQTSTEKYIKTAKVGDFFPIVVDRLEMPDFYFFSLYNYAVNNY